LLVLLTSELARNAYRSQASADETNPLAAFKESGAIEYAAETALVLRNVLGGGGLIDVAVPKNRGYLRTTFRMEMDPRSTAFREVGQPDGDGTKRDAQRAARAELEARAADVLKIVARNPGVGSRALRAKVTAAGLRLGVPKLDAVLELLEGSGRVRNDPVTHGKRTDPHFYAVGGAHEGDQ
jgi:hypothetical protein